VFAVCVFAPVAWHVLSFDPPYFKSISSAIASCRLNSILSHFSFVVYSFFFLYPSSDSAALDGDSLLSGAVSRWPVFWRVGQAALLAVYRRHHSAQLFKVGTMGLLCFMYLPSSCACWLLKSDLRSEHKSLAALFFPILHFATQAL
jgi:hypothetical protein